MKTRKAYIIKKDSSKFWFDIPKDTAIKVLKLQEMFKKDQEKKEADKTKIPKQKG